MKVRINMPGKSASADFEDADQKFAEMVNLLFELPKTNRFAKVRHKILPVEPISEEETAILLPEIGKQEVADQEEVEEQEQEDKGIRVKGFIYWRCPDCGYESGFCLKKESKGVHCMKCGSDRLFDKPLTAVYPRCECGTGYKYLTNLTDEMFDINCINCGSPMTVRYNEHKRVYQCLVH